MVFLRLWMGWLGYDGLQSFTHFVGTDSTLAGNDNGVPLAAITELIWLGGNTLPTPSYRNILVNDVRTEWGVMHCTHHFDTDSFSNLLKRIVWHFSHHESVQHAASREAHEILHSTIHWHSLWASTACLPVTMME